MLNDRLKETEERFKGLFPQALPYKPGGIWTSEAFAFLTFCEMFEVDVIIESGVSHARSTIYWQKYYEDFLVDIIAIDIKPPGANIQELVKKGVKFFQGDSQRLIPNIYKNMVGDHNNVGIFLDGPKGLRALTFAQNLLSYPRVKFVAMHDFSRTQFKKPLPARVAFDKINKYFKFTTDEPWFVEKYKHMDAADGEGQSVLSEFGSYGFTIAILAKEEFRGKISR